MERYSDVTIFVAKDLRTRGYTYQEIRNYLKTNIPKSTLSGWLKYTPTPPFYQGKIAILTRKNLKQARKLALTKNKELLEQRLNELSIKNTHLISRIDRSIAILLLATLYWCEGAKYPSHNGIRFGSSDPEMIRLFIVLLRCCYKLDENKFRLTIQCRADQGTKGLILFWQDITSIPPAMTYKPQIDRRSIGIPTQKKSYKGVCVIEYLDTDIQCELQFLGRFLGTTKSTDLMKNQIK